MRLLLDTYVLLWWLSDDRKLTKYGRDIIANPDNDVLVSSASVWEVAIKAALKRIEIELDDLKTQSPETASGPCPSASVTR